MNSCHSERTTIEDVTIPHNFLWSVFALAPFRVRSNASSVGNYIPNGKVYAVNEASAVGGLAHLTHLNALPRGRMEKRGVVPQAREILPSLSPSANTKGGKRKRPLLILLFIALGSRKKRPWNKGRALPTLALVLHRGFACERFLLLDGGSRAVTTSWWKANTTYCLYALAQIHHPSFSQCFSAFIANGNAGSMQDENEGLDARAWQKQKAKQKS